MGWPLVELGEVAAQVARPEPPLPGSAYRLIGVRLWGRGAYERETIDGSETKYASLFKNRAGDIIVNKIWARNGSVAVVDPALDGTFGSSEFPTYRADESKLLPDWFRYFTLTSDLWSQCDKLSRGTSGQNRLRPEQFLGVRIPLPPVDEQRRIVEKLDRVAALVDERRSAIEAAERETQALLLKAFQRAIDGAPLRPMAEVAPLVRRPVEIDLDAAYPELGVRSFGRGTFHKPDLLGADLSWQKLFLVQQGDLVFSNIKAWEGAFAVAGPEDHGRVGSHRYLTCVPIHGLATADFIWFYLQTSEGLGKVQSASPGSADRNRTLGQGALEAITVPTPPINRQDWFDRLHAKAREARAIRASTAQDVQALIPAMLHEIFDGQVEAA